MSHIYWTLAIHWAQGYDYMWIIIIIEFLQQSYEGGSIVLILYIRKVK